MNDHDDHLDLELHAAEVALEPFSWAWIGTKLAEGALQWAGGRLLGSLFGSYDNANQRIGELLKTELREAALQRATALLESLTIRIGQYHNAGGLDRLALANKDAEDLAAELRSLGLAGFRSYHGAIGLAILVLQDRFKASGHPGEKQNIRETIDRASSVLWAMHPKVLSAAAARVGDVWFDIDPLSNPPSHIAPGVPSFRHYHAGHQLDGGRVKTCEGLYSMDSLPDLLDEARRKRDEAIETLREAAKREQVLPSMDILMQWNAIRKQL